MHFEEASSSVDFVTSRKAGVLVIDHDAAFREVVAASLRAADVATTCLESVSMALDLDLSCEFDAVLVDAHWSRRVLWLLHDRFPSAPSRRLQHRRAT